MHILCSRNEQLFNVIICNIFSVKTRRIYLNEIPLQYEVKYDIRLKRIKFKRAIHYMFFKF